MSLRPLPFKRIMHRGPLPEHAPTSRFLDTPEPNETFFAKGNGVRAGWGGPRARPVQWDCFSISPEFDETLFRQGKWSRASRTILPERAPNSRPFDIPRIQQNALPSGEAGSVRGGALPERGLRSEDKERGISAKRPCLGFLQSSVRGYAARRERPAPSAHNPTSLPSPCCS